MGSSGVTGCRSSPDAKLRLAGRWRRTEQMLAECRDMFECPSARRFSGRAHSAGRRCSALDADWSDQMFSTAASRPDRIASANA